MFKTLITKFFITQTLRFVLEYNHYNYTLRHMRAIKQSIRLTME